MAFEEDLAPFFDEDEFATLAIYNSSTEVRVIFDNTFLSQLGIAGTNPAALGQAIDFPAAAVGKTLKIGTTTYTIRGREPQDDGAVVLLQLEVS